MSDSSPVLDQLNLVVRDMDATLAFYRRLGLHIPDTAAWRTASGAHHVEVVMPNGMHLEFEHPVYRTIITSRILDIQTQV